MQCNETGADDIGSVLVADYDHYTHVVGINLTAIKPNLKAVMGEPDDQRTLTALELYQGLGQILRDRQEIHGYTVRIKPSGLESSAMWIVRDDENQTLWLNQ